MEKGVFWLASQKTDCHICGKRGHWKAECPENPANKESANVVQHIGSYDAHMEVNTTEQNEFGSSSSAHIIVESFEPPGLSEFSDFQEDLGNEPNETNRSVCIHHCQSVDHHCLCFSSSVIHTGYRHDNSLRNRTEDQFEDAIVDQLPGQDNISHQNETILASPFCSQEHATYLDAPDSIESDEERISSTVSVVMDQKIIDTRPFWTPVQAEVSSDKTSSRAC